ncbi:MAG TPA: NPCBM/NEW2 domain-containing protein [Arachnia sp.]|nr:NPCBM/NEW2 domain-containing protein [Arachnia sp.]HMT85816.1 NPCBM/NEW2 domain-containing protein [Arachnia sp.]
MPRNGALAAVLVGALVLTSLPAATAAASPRIASPTTVAASSEESPREAVNFNRDWRFIRQNVQGAQTVGFDDSSWVDVALPHSFDAPYDVGGSNGGQSFSVGAGWYRKTFEVPASWDGKRLELDFEGSFQITDIWVNGAHVTTHRGGFTGFNVDISEHVHPGDNEIAVRVDSSWQHDLAPRAGDHQFTGGIYRDVTLNVTDGVHVAWYGTFVTTPALTNPDWDTSNPAYYRNIDLSQYPSPTELQANIDAKRSNVLIQTEVENESPGAAEVAVVHEVKDPDGEVIATFESEPQTLAAGEVATIDAASGALGDTAAMLSDLRLWSPSDPALYTVETAVVVGDQVTDTFDSTFGFRSAQYRKDGFYLNGEKTLLFGANAHQDQAGWGNAVADSGFDRDVQMVREAGMNFIRGSHYPHDRAYAEATDRLGVMFWSESVLWGMGGQAGKDAAPIGQPSDWLRDAYPQNPAHEAAFEQSNLDALEAMIRVNRNHPSIINWAMGNEVFFTANGTQAKAKALVSKLRDRSHELDPTRKAGMGGVQRNGFDQLSVSDIAGYNGDGGDMENSWMANLVAEYGSHTSDRPGSYAPHYDYVADPSDSQKFKLENGSAGLTIWAGFDHGSVGGAGLARMGMIDYSRLPKLQWYWFRENKARWTGLTQVADPVPVPRETSVSGTATKMTLAPSKYSSDTITDDGRTDTQLVLTLQNAAGQWVNDSREVTLTVTSGPGILPGGKSYTFRPGTTMFDGRAAVSFRSYYAGTSTITASTPGLPDATVQITTTRVVGDAGETEPADFWDATLWGAQTSAIVDPVAYGGVNKALSRPLTASSEQAGNGRALAADGDSVTSWVAAADGPGQSIASFLEVAQNVYKIRLDFPGDALPFTLEVQGEGTGWTTVASYTAATVGSRPLEESLDGLSATAVRVSFPNLTASQRATLAELQVFGNDAAQSPQYAADGVYVSDILDYANKVTTGWGQKVKDTSASGNPIRVGGTTYAKGVGLHAQSLAIVDLNGKYSRLAGIAGIDSGSPSGDAIFEIYADGQLIFSRQLAGSATGPFNLSVNGVQQLRLVTDPNGANSNDHTDWADLRLLGAIRDITAAGTGVTASFVGMTDQLRAGEDYRASVTLANTGDTARALTAGVMLYDASGALQEIRTQNVQIAAAKSGTVDLTIPIGNDITGGYATIGAWDSADLGAASSFARVSADPDRLTGGSPAEIIWAEKVDGESASLQKTGTWALWPTSAAYAGTETYTETAGATLSYAFTGEYVRVGAKFDGSQVGFDVYVDDVKKDTVSTRVTDGSNTYRVAWTSDRLAAVPHTLRLVTTGKAGVDYVESGSAAPGETGETPAYHGLLQAVAEVIGLIDDGVIADAQAAPRAALAEAFADAYTVYRNQASTSGDYDEAETALRAAIDALGAGSGEQALALEVSATLRCVAGKVHVVATVRNTDDADATIAITTPFGSKTNVALPSGKGTSAAFNSRSATVAAGSVTVSGTAEGRIAFDGTAGHPGTSCS